VQKIDFLCRRSVAAGKLNFLMTVHARLAYCHTRLLTEQVETLPQAFSADHLGTRVSRTPAASNR
jgi:hypothetical protein